MNRIDTSFRTLIYLALAACLTLPSAALAQSQEDAVAEEAINASQGEGALGRLEWSTDASFSMLGLREDQSFEDSYALYYLSATAPLSDALSVYARAGLEQVVSAAPGSSPVNWLDAKLGASFSQGVDLGAEELALTHGVAFYLPTSPSSRTERLFTAIDATETLSWSPRQLRRLTLSANAAFQYRVHDVDEAAGLDTAMNNRWSAGLGLGADWRLFRSSRFGSASVGVGLARRHMQRYVANDEAERAAGSPPTSAWEDTASVHFVYTPIEQLSLGVTLQHFAPVEREGAENFDDLYDETGAVFSITGRL